MCDASSFAFLLRYKHTSRHTKKQRILESAVFLVFPVGGSQTWQSWHSQSRNARGNGAPHGMFMAGPAGGTETATVCVYMRVRVCVGWGWVLHLKFHNICSIGRTIYTNGAGVFTGSHCNWGFGVCVCVLMCMCVSMCGRLCMHRCFNGGETRSGSDNGRGMHGY